MVVTAEWSRGLLHLSSFSQECAPSCLSRHRLLISLSSLPSLASRWLRFPLPDPRCIRGVLFCDKNVTATLRVRSCRDRPRRQSACRMSTLKEAQAPGRVCTERRGDDSPSPSCFYGTPREVKRTSKCAR